jgi:hypothetical protein
MNVGSDHPADETVVVPESAQIAVSQPHRPMTSLPSGFAEVDIAVLDWIVAEAGD